MSSRAHDGVADIVVRNVVGNRSSRSSSTYADVAQRFPWQAAREFTSSSLRTCTTEVAHGHHVNECDQQANHNRALGTSAVPRGRVDQIVDHDANNLPEPEPAERIICSALDEFRYLAVGRVGARPPGTDGATVLATPMSKGGNLLPFGRFITFTVWPVAVVKQ